MGIKNLSSFKKKISLWFILTIFALTIIAVQVASANNTSYYVDCLAGTNGTGTIGSPWNALSSVNNHAAFQPGDKILLKKGTACSGQLHPLGSGSSGSPITIDAYGSGTAPIINGGGTSAGTGAVYLINQQYWVIQNLEVTNSTTDLTVDRAGIYVALNNYGGTANNIRILNNYVHDVDSKTDNLASGGILVRTFSNSLDKWNDVVIQGNTVMNVGRVGISILDFSWDSAGQASTNISVLQNVVSRTDGDMISIYGTDGALVDHNSASYGGQTAIDWIVGYLITRSFNPTIQYNEAYQMQAPGSYDSEGIDIDLGTVNAVVQYNYTHDNRGGGFLVCGGRDTLSGSTVDSDNITIRYNISQNDVGHGPLAFSCPAKAKNLNIYNNTFYLDAATTSPVIDSYHSYSNPTQAWNFTNNIIYQLGSGGYNLPGTGGVFDYNVFYGNHPGSEPSDAHKSTADPLLVAPGSGGTGISSVNGYKLQPSSPALNSGVFISGNGGFDYWGNTVSPSAAPNRGAYNGTGVKPELLFNNGFELPQWDAAASVITQDTTAFHSGGKSMKSASRTQVYGATRQDVKDMLLVNGQGTYNFSAWAKFATGTGNAFIILSLNDSAGTHVYSGTYTSIGSASFAQMSTSANVTWTGTLTRAILYVQTESSLNDIFVDDFVLTKSGSANLVSNPGMEKVQYNALASTLTLEKTDVHSGSYGVKVTARTNAWSSAAFDIKDILTANGTGTYDFSGWAKMASGSDNMIVIINLNDSTGNHLFTSGTSSVGTSAFVKLSSSQTITWTGSLTSARIYVQTVSSTNDMYVDDYSLVKF